MKKTILYGLILAMMAWVTGCGSLGTMFASPVPTASPTPVPTPKPTPKVIEYDKYKMTEQVKAQLAFDRDLYNKILDAVDSYSGSYLADRAVTAEEMQMIYKALISRPEFGYLKGITVDQDGQNILFEYHQEQEAALSNKEKFRTKVETILANLVKQEYSQFETMLSLYRYLAQGITLSGDELGAYSAIMDGQANAKGITYAMQTLLDQIGYENHIATAADNSLIWNIVKIDGRYYHFDAALENKSNKGQRLLYFGMSDDERKNNMSFTEWHVGLPEKETYITAECVGANYLHLRNVGLGYGIDFEEKLMYFSDVTQDGVIQQFSYLNQVGQALFGKRSGALVFHKGTIYFADTDNRNQLYKMDIKTGTCELIDSIFVTRMMVKNNHLIYFDDVSSTEKSIVLP